MNITTNKEVKEVSKKIGGMIASVRNGLATQYLTVYNSEDELISIRVSNHLANPKSINVNDISLIVFVEEKESEDESYSSFVVNKKTFRNSSNQFDVTEDGNVNDGFDDVSIEDFLTEKFL